MIDLNPSHLAANHLVEPLPFNMVERNEHILHTHPFMVERHGLLAFTLPVMVESKQHEMYTLPFMVERKQHKIYTHPFVVERHNRDALPFMVEETYQVAYSNMRVDNMYKHTSETFNLENAGFSTCLELRPELCKGDYTFSEYVDLKLHKIWLHLRSSPLLELYVRAFFTLLRLFDIISQRDLPSVKC